VIDKYFSGGLEKIVLSPHIRVMLKKISSKYQLYAGIFSRVLILGERLDLSRPPNRFTEMIFTKYLIW
jgi:hypothetical protein